MREVGITPPPRNPLFEKPEDPTLWPLWARWFSLITASYPKVRTYHATLNPALVAAGTTAEQTFSVTGLDTNDIVFVNKPSLTAGIGVVGARVSAADTLAITFVNATAGGIDPPSEQYSIVTVRF
jgi:hypothetical protein